MKKIIVVTMIVMALLPMTAMAEGYGTYGRFVIDGTDIDVPLYLYGCYDTIAIKSAVDAENSAVIVDYYDWFQRPTAMYIADHRNQGFDELYDIVPGETTALIEFADGSEMNYICEELDREGHNNEYGICFSDWREVATVIPSDWVYSYTCNPEGWWSITIATWRPID